MMSPRVTMTLFAGLMLGACSSKPAGLSTADQGPAMPIDHAGIGPASSASARVQRMSVSQLRGALPVVLGNDLAGAPITWRINGKPGLDQMGESLGEADYIERTQDDLEPSPLYLKFVNDAARDACARAVVADYGRPTKSARSLLRQVELGDTVATAATAVDSNLRYLKLRFHGVKVDAADVSSIADLRTAFSAAVKASAGSSTPTEANVKEGWRTVCVALLTAPEFHLY